MVGVSAPGPAPAGDAVARIVHDLHGPLTVIRGLCATLARGEPAAERQRAIALIDGEAIRLAEGLRGLAGAAEGRAGQVASPLDLAALIISTTERFAPIAADRGARTALRGVHTPVWVPGDPAMLERLVENLLANAIRHCAAGGLVELALAARDGRALLRVRDDGDGVPASDRERIFRPGERGSAPRDDGRGLGLAIAREIAEAHGGRLTLDAVGVGACFRVSIPLLAPDRGPRAA